MKKLEPSYTAGRNVKLINNFGKQIAVPQKVKYRALPYNPLIHILKRIENKHLKTKTYPQMFIVALFVIVKKWKQSIYQLVNKM